MVETTNESIIIPIENNNTTNPIEDAIRTEFRTQRSIGIEERIPVQKIQNTKKAQPKIWEANATIRKIIEEQTEDTPISLEDLNALIYAAAKVVSDIENPEQSSPTNRRRMNNGPPLWQKRLEARILGYRKELSKLANAAKDKNRQRVEELMATHRANDRTTTEEAIEYLKQRTAALAQRVRRYKKRAKQYYQNRQYEKNQKSFFRSLRDTAIRVDKIPTVEEVDTFWRGIYEDDIKHNEEAEWIRKFKCNSEMTWRNITAEEVKAVIKNTSNWKAPGPDKINNFWLKQFTATHRELTRIFNELVGGEHFPGWFARGTTFLVPKNINTEDPKNYRPITCLNTTFKLFTAVIGNRLTEYVEEAQIVPNEQKGCRRNAKGCVDQLLITKNVVSDCRKNNKNLSLAWIDYRKAFDSVPHSWILQCLQKLGVHENVIRTCEVMMKVWATTIQFGNQEERLSTGVIRILRGIYQGDSLSPIIFVLCLVPLSHAIRALGNGYRVESANTTISHLLFVDDLKLFAENDKALKKQLKTVGEVSRDIRMDFGLDKCAKACFKNGKYSYAENINLEANIEIRNMEEGEVYKYLGMEEKDGISHARMKAKLRDEYNRRVRKILRTELSAANKLTAIGTFAVPVLQYSFGIVEWTTKEMKGIDTKTRKMLTMHKAHHPSADIDRLYVSRKEGGRGLRQVEGAYKATLIGLRSYLEEKARTDPFMKMVRKLDGKERPKASVAKIAEQLAQEEGYVQVDEHTKYQRTQAIKKKISSNIQAKWTRKPMFGQYPRRLMEENLSKSRSVLWLTRGHLKVETESLIVAAQDQALATRYRIVKIHGIPGPIKCRMCEQFDETIDHVVGGCPTLAKKDYLTRHNRVCTQIHYNICKTFGVPVRTEKWYEHQPERVATSRDEKVTVLWDYPIQTDRTVTSHKPDIVVKQQGGECLIIDVAIPMDKNLKEKESEKKLKYANLETEIKRMWNCKAKIIPVIIGATGIVEKASARYLKSLPCEVSFASLQKTAVLGTATILRKVIN